MVVLDVNELKIPQEDKANNTKERRSVRGNFIIIYFSKGSVFFLA